MPPSIDQLADQLRAARRVTVLTGAGVSAASGVPTFRGIDGLWKRYRPEELATPEAFARDPRLVWEWYDWRRQRVAACRPNRAHEVLAEWSRRPGWRIVTQNVDDLHLRAGTEGLVRLHGSLWEVSCWNRCAAAARRWRDDTVPLADLPLRCPHCRGLARPAVVWFGESLEPEDMQAAVEATACDVFLTVGTSAVVYPAADLVHQAARAGAFTAEINLEPTPSSPVVNLSILGRAEELLDHIRSA